MKQKLLELLKTVPETTLTGISIQLKIRENKIEKHLPELKDAYETNPKMMKKIIGFNLLKHL